MLPPKTADLPPPPVFKHLLGPSFILLGLGLGSGELILWPHLAVNFGLGIMWGAVLGITLQFFMNMEIERYALARGESIFVGFARKSRLLPVWFILSTIIPWMWPGIIASASLLFGTLFGIKNTNFLGIALLLLIGIALTLGPILYKTQEFFQKYLILVSFPFILFLTIYLANGEHWLALTKGLVGLGDGYFFLPKGISLASFLAAFAYAGAGGNLNLAQSFYIKEKGFGMGKYSGKITSILTGKEEKITLEGTTFACNPNSVDCFKKWWKLINVEHFLVFWLTGLATILLLSLLAYTTTFGETAGVSFLIQESLMIGQRTYTFFGSIFIAVGAAMLFSTQFGVLDTTSRILTENLSLVSKRFFPPNHLRRNFYLFLWIQIILGILILALNLAEPLTLVIIGAVLNALAMFVHIGLTIWTNLTILEKPIRPSLLRLGIMLLAFVFFGGFSLFTILDYLF